MSHAFRPDLPVVVLSRLDGTVLDPCSFDPAEAGQTAEHFARVQIPLVFLSNRTRAQLELVQQQLDLHHPFVSENGGAVFFPRHYFDFDVPHARLVAGYQSVGFGAPYADVVHRLQTTATRLGIGVVGFNDLSVQAVAEAYGLSMLQARLAKLREHDEPFRLTEPGAGVDEGLIKSLRAAGIRCVAGGRSTHATGDIDHRRIVDLLRALYSQALGRPALIVGIGDALHDLPFLKHVDIPMLFRSQGSDAVAAQLSGAADVRVMPAGRAGDRAGALQEIARMIHRRVVLVPATT